MAGHVSIDRSACAARIAGDIAELSGPDYTRSQTTICRYAYTPEYRRTLDWFTRELEAAGCEVREDCVGNLVARNRPRGEKLFGLGSHCDSNRNGGSWDGALGVVIALEVCRQSRELGLELPLGVISFLEEESSGFHQGLLGSRIMAGWVDDEELAGFTAIDDDRPFIEHAREAGYRPEEWRNSRRQLDDLIGWIEPHIEQGPYLWDSGEQLGIVTGIIGFAFSDLTVHGVASHAGGTPMDVRKDACVVTAECVVELERLANAAGHGTVGTVGEVEVSPNIVNAVPGEVRFSLDIRSTEESAFHGVLDGIVAFAEQAAARRGMTVTHRPRQRAVPPAKMDARILAALEASAQTAGIAYRHMPSRGGHDTICVAAHVPSAMVFVPCRDGISHAPEEEARPEDAAIAVEVILNAVAALV